MAYEHTICQHCDDAPCLNGLPGEGHLQAARTARSSSTRQVCKGSHNCVEACPYGGVIYYNEDLRIAQKCTFCAHLLDKGWTQTRCSEACPTGAITFGEEEELAELIAQAEAATARSGT